MEIFIVYVYHYCLGDIYEQWSFTNEKDAIECEKYLEELVKSPEDLLGVSFSRSSLNADYKTQRSITYLDGRILYNK